VSAAVLVDAPARITRAADGRLEVMLRADIQLTAPVGDLITDAIDSEWPQHDDEPAIGQREQIQPRRSEVEAQPVEGESGDASAMPTRVRELVRRSCLGSRSSRRSAVTSSVTAASDVPPARRAGKSSGRQMPLGLGMVTAILLVSALFADSSTDDDPCDGHFGFAADALRPHVALVTHSRPRDEHSTPTGS
jgi:hypothetical protein